MLIVQVGHGAAGSPVGGRAVLDPGPKDLEHGLHGAIPNYIILDYTISYDMCTHVYIYIYIYIHAYTHIINIV